MPMPQKEMLCCCPDESSQNEFEARPRPGPGVEISRNSRGTPDPIEVPPTGDTSPRRLLQVLSSPKVGYLKSERTTKLSTSRWSVPDFLLGTRVGHVIGLVILFLVLINSGALCWMATGGDETYDDTLYESYWFSWGMFFDPGTQMGFPADSAVKYKVTAVIFSIFGFTYNLLILGLIVEMARVGLDTLHKRWNRVVENGHSLVLGWSEKTLFLLKEMSAAAKNRGQANRVVVLADQDEAVMWAEIRRHFPKYADRRNYICRRGSPYECDDLVKASAKSARDIVILGPKRKARESDLDIIRALVALAALPEQPSGTVIAEVRSWETAQVVRSVLAGAEGMLARDPVNRVLALMALDPIVGDCFNSLFSFLHGEEFYCKHLRDMAAEVQHCRTFGELCRALPAALCVGVNPPHDLTMLSPPDDYVLGEDDRVVVLASSEEEVTGGRKGFLRRTGTMSDHILKTEACNDRRAPLLIIVGWSPEMGERLLALDDYAFEGTQVHMLNLLPVKERNSRLESTLAATNFKRITLIHHVGSTTSVRKLAKLPLPEASAVMIVADLQDTDAAESDAACLGCAVTVNRLCRGLNETYIHCASTARIICEVMDPRTARVLLNGGQLADVATFFHSSALETGIFAMASNDPAVLNTLLMLLRSQQPRTIAAVPVSDYLDSGIDPGQFWSLWDAVRARGEVFLGWHDRDMKQTVLNPHKDMLTGLTEVDKIVVVRHALGTETG